MSREQCDTLEEYEAWLDSLVVDDRPTYLRGTESSHERYRLIMPGNNGRDEDRDSFSEEERRVAEAIGCPTEEDHHTYRKRRN